MKKQKIIYTNPELNAIAILEDAIQKLKKLQELQITPIKYTSRECDNCMHSCRSCECYCHTN